MTTTDRTNAKKAVKSYLKAIQQRDFIRAYDLTQFSWRKSINNLEAAMIQLRNMYLYEFNNLDIRNTKKIGNCSIDVEFKFHWLGCDYIGIARVICESASFKPTIEGGTWGVNPTSVLRIHEVKDAKEKAGKTEKAAGK